MRSRSTCLNAFLNLINSESKGNHIRYILFLDHFYEDSKGFLFGDKLILNVKITMILKTKYRKKKKSVNDKSSKAQNICEKRCRGNAENFYEKIFQQSFPYQTHNLGITCYNCPAKKQPVHNFLSQWHIQ